MARPGGKRVPRHFLAADPYASPCRTDPKPGRWIDTAPKQSWQRTPARAREGQEERECDRVDAACDFSLSWVVRVRDGSVPQFFARALDIRPADRGNTRPHARRGCQKNVISLYNSCLRLGCFRRSGEEGDCLRC